MEIDEYRIEFLNQLRNDASLNQNDVDDEFINTTIGMLEEIGELTDPFLLRYAWSQRPCNGL